MTTFRVKNFEQFQHYKDRSPPWIKLYNELLDDYKFACLQDASKLHLILIWLLASRSNNILPLDAAWISKRINATSKVDLQVLIDAGFLIINQQLHNVEHVASNTLADCSDIARPERETETETETEKKGAAVAAPDARTQLFTEGLSSLHRQTGKPEQALRRLVGRWLRDVADDAVLVRRTIEDAERHRVADAVAWITRALKPKSRPPDFQTPRDLTRQKWSNALERLGEYAAAPESSDVRKEIVRILPATGSGKS